MCIPGSINKWDLTALDLAPDTSLFTSIRHQSVNINPKSTTAFDDRMKSTLSSNSLGHMLNLKMSAGALSKVQAYPVFNMADEQVNVDNEPAILLTAIYKAYEYIVWYNNVGKIVIAGSISSTRKPTVSSTNTRTLVVHHPM